MEIKLNIKTVKMPPPQKKKKEKKKKKKKSHYDYFDK